MTAILVYAFVSRAGQLSLPRRHECQPSSGSPRRPCLSYGSPAAANSRTPDKRLCGTAPPPASGRTAAEGYFRCGRLPQSWCLSIPVSAPRQPSVSSTTAMPIHPILPPGTMSGLLINPQHSIGNQRRRLPHSPGGAAGRVRQPSFLTHRLTAGGFTPIIRAMALWETPYPCNARPVPGRRRWGGCRRRLWV